MPDDGVRLMSTSKPAPAAPTRRSIANDLMGACRAAGSTHVFGVPGGGSNLDVVGAAIAHGLEFVLVHTETAAAIMAGVMAELNATPGICVATRGPGAASMVNGVAQAMLDRQPLVAITDSVAASDQARVSHQRLDQQVLMGTVTKRSLVLDGCTAGHASQVVRLCLDNRPGPVHVDIDPSHSPIPPPEQPATLEQQTGDLTHALQLVRASRRPVFIVGVGAIAQSAAGRRATVDAINAIGRSTNVPVLCTYKARGVVADTSAWCAGVASGATIESPVLNSADLIIGVGLDPVELIPAAWDYPAPVVLLGSWVVDDSSFFGARLAAEAAGDLSALIAEVSAVVNSTWEPAAAEAHRQQANLAVRAAVPSHPTALTPQQVVELAAVAAPRGTIATIDAGAHMLVAVPLWPTNEPGELLISSGLATMGFALPAAIAAALARPDRRVICFTGDGGIGMALAELETVARLGLNITIVVFNDSTLSLIAAKQLPHGHGGAAAVTYRPTDFAGIAAAFGLPGQRVADAASYSNALARAFTQDGPGLLDVAVDPTAYGAVLDAIRGTRLPVTK